MSKPPFTYQDIPRFPHSAYEIDVQFAHIESHLADCEGLNLEPEYQRAHVWTEAQQIAYVEYMLRGGEVSRTIIINAPQWRTHGYKSATLVDGKQRLEALRKFMRSELPVFGGYTKNEIGGHLRLFNGRIHWRVVALNTEAEVLDLYLSINAGGTPHSEAEIAKVRKMRSEIV